jgi:site-specific recombinase XerD
VEFHLYALRLDVGKNLIDAGVSLEKVASLLGHISLNTIHIYITPGERELKAVGERLAG